MKYLLFISLYLLYLERVAFEFLPGVRLNFEQLV